MDFYERMESKYPTVLRTWDVECPVGWEKLVEDLLSELEVHAKTVNPDLRIEQIKSKFGGLRCYVSGEDSRAEQIIHRFEQQSMTLCEACGKPGTRTGKGWISTLCEVHK